LQGNLLIRMTGLFPILYLNEANLGCESLFE